MKRKISIISALCLVCVLAMSLFASAERQNNAKITAAKGTPTIDGEIDDIWALTEAQPVVNVDTVVLPSNVATTGTVRTLWDENNLYVLIEVDKHGVAVTEAKADEADENKADCAEVSFSMEGDFDIAQLWTTEKEGVGNIKVFTNGLKNGFGPYYDNHAADVTAVMKLTANDKYVVEYALPWAGVTPAVGTVATLEVQINHCTFAKRTGHVSWASTTGCWGWQETDVHGALELGAAVAGNTGGNSGNTGADTGAESAVAAAVGAVFAAAGLIVLSKKK
ncbi:MAG: hypothetical protein IKI50_04660 [Clostridia bacterium]|nr:hypothetical protein [Clostridia bacterium]